MKRVLKRLKVNLQRLASYLLKSRFVVLFFFLFSFVVVIARLCNKSSRLHINCTRKKFQNHARAKIKLCSSFTMNFASYCVAPHWNVTRNSQNWPPRLFFKKTFPGFRFWKKHDFLCHLRIHSSFKWFLPRKQMSHNETDGHEIIWERKKLKRLFVRGGEKKIKGM